LADASAAGGVTAFAPATVANVTCGFDLLGFAIEEPGDRVTARRRPEPGVTLEVYGDDGALPRDPERNTAGVAVHALLEERRAAGEDTAGVELRLRKGLPLASGLGSSAASAVAAVVAADALFTVRSPRSRLLRCAMEGERVACGTAHADNAAPSLLGGLVLVRGDEPRVDTLPVAPDYFVAVVHPRAEVRTEVARAVLPRTVATRDAVAQAGNLAALVSGLARGEDELVATALVDVIAEPARAGLAPGFPEVLDAARGAGALGGGLSGSGPSLFAVTRGRDTAERVVAALAAALEERGLAVDRFVSTLGAPGARLLEEAPCGS